MTDDKPPCTHHRLTQRCYICNPHTEDEIAAAVEPSMPIVTSKNRSRAEAQAALQVYMSQEIEARTISLIEALVWTLADSPTNDVRVVHRGCPLGSERSRMLQQIEELKLGTLTCPSWIGRFGTLIEEIRDEFNLPHAKGEPPPGEGDAAP